MNKNYSLVCKVDKNGKCVIFDNEIYNETVKWFEKRIRSAERNIHLCTDDEVLRLGRAYEEYADFLSDNDKAVEAFRQYINAYESVTASDNVLYIDDRLPDDTMSIFGNGRRWRTYYTYSSKITDTIERLRHKCTGIAHQYPELMDFIKTMTSGQELD